MSDDSDEAKRTGQDQAKDVVGPLAVKSNAVVKFVNIPNVPAGSYKHLQCNTNLNLPPENWMKSSNGGCGLHQSLYHSSDFASFRMAHQFADCVGEVDVVSDAENIKRLLKLPYTANGTVSMIVHKVGNTILLDEFDIQKYLLRKADANWAWIRNFILEYIFALEQKDLNFCLRDKSREALRTKNLLSKFLYYSMQSSSSYAQANDEDDETASLSSSRSSAASTATTAGPSSSSAPSGKSHRTAGPSRPVAAEMPPPLWRQPVLPEPKLEQNVPDPKSTHVFSRNVVWTFEDIRMLIGTDMPIFGGPNRPCISLRLRDMAKPINVLTGIDYWLDNLMCNVPEVLMCYHLDGIVQKYEIIKTEDLPHLENSQFSPQLVRDVAQNILSFLKANATKSGHTYWLFKGRNDDVVKLYDLSTLYQAADTAAEPKDPKGNPFTVPVAMLLYTVARNMKNSKVQPSAKSAGAIRSLLESCIKLLPKEEHPQIVTSSHYMLSDLYVPAYVDPKHPKFESPDTETDSTSLYDQEDEDDPDEDDDEDQDDEEDDFFGGCSRQASNLCEMNNNQQAAVQNLSASNLKVFHLKEAVAPPKPKRKRLAPEPLVAEIVERCEQALHHVSGGISCLQYFNATQEQHIKETEARAKNGGCRSRELYEEQHPNMAKPSKAIPLPYEHLGDYGTTPLTSPLALNTYQRAVSVADSPKSAKPKKPPASQAAAAVRPSKTGVTPAKFTSEQIQNQVAVNFNSQMFGSWNVHLKLLLLEKACLTYATLAEHHYEAAKYGTSLKFIHLAYRCHQVIVKHMRSEARRSCLLARAGDCFFQIYTGFDQLAEYLEQYNERSADDKFIVQQVDKEIGADEDSDLVNPPTNMERVLLASCKYYEQAQAVLQENGSQAKDDDGARQLQRRIGNAYNELGVKYMNWALCCIVEGGVEPSGGDKGDIVYTVHASSANPLAKAGSSHKKPKSSRILPNDLSMELAMKSFNYLSRAIDTFEKVNDDVNMAFIYSNMGRFMRFRGHLQTADDGSYEFQYTLKTFYYHAFSFYDKALGVLDTRKTNESLWDLINWEYSSATFSLAGTLQEEGIPKTHDASSRTELEREVLDLLHKALARCDTESPTNNQVMYIYRSAILHQRIASFHHSKIRRSYGDLGSVLKSSLQLARYHYDRSITIFRSLNMYKDDIEVTLERLSLQDFLCEVTSNVVQKSRNMVFALEICLRARALFECAAKSLTGDEDVNSLGEPLNDEECDAKTFEKHIVMFESGLSNALKTLIKLSVQSKDSKNACNGYKEMYKETLAVSRLLIGDQKAATVDIVLQMHRTLLRLEEIYAKMTSGTYSSAGQANVNAAKSATAATPTAAVTQKLTAHTPKLETVEGVDNITVTASAKPVLESASEASVTAEDQKPDITADWNARQKKGKQHNQN